METEKNINNGRIIFFIILLLAIAGISVYSYFGSQLYHRAESAYEEQHWQEANDLFTEYQETYNLSIPVRSVQVKEYISITGLLSKAQTLEEQEEYEQLLSTYNSIRFNYLDLYEEMDIAQKEYVTYFNWADQLYQNGSYEQADAAYTKIKGKYSNHNIFDPDQDIDELMPQFYFDWAAALRENNDYADAIAKYNFITDTYGKAEISRKIEPEVQNTYLAWADYLLDQKEFEQAFAQLDTIQENWPMTKISDISSGRYIESGLAYSSLLHENQAYKDEIGILEKIFGHLPGAEGIDQVQEQLSLAYESYAEQCATNDKYFDAITYFQKYRETVTDAEIEKDIDDKIKSAQQAILDDSGADGRQMLEQISQAVCTGDSKLPEIVSLIPADASKVLICGETTYNITPVYIATTPAELRYIIHFENEMKELEICPYEDNYQIIRKQNYVDILVYDSKTGKRIIQDRIYGPEPVECEDRYSFSELTETRYGAEVTLFQIDTWIEDKLIP